MTRQIFASLLSVSLLGAPALVGCDETLSHKEKTTSTPEGTKHTETTVKERPDGTIVKEESKTKSTDDNRVTP
jgi:hypothetical protein